MITTTEPGADGRPVVVKRSTKPTDLAGISREARMLELARHPGVVEVAGHPADGGELSTRLAGTRTLAAPGLATGTRLRALAAATETVADLHALGLVHGRLEESHIILGSEGRPVLCGFGHAGLAGEPDSTGRPRRTSDDVAALGAVLDRALVTPEPDTTAVGKLTRWRLPRNGPARRRLDRAELHRLAQQATDPDPGRRLTARRLAAELDRLSGRDRRAGPAAAPASDQAGDLVHDRAPDPASDGTGDGDGDEIQRLLDDIARLRAQATASPGRRHRAQVRPRIATGVAALVGLGLLVAGGAALSAPSEGTGPSLAGPESSMRDDSIAAPPERRAGGELDIEGHRYALGTADDIVLLADWGCRGSRTAVVVQPSGAVYRFDGWATATDLTGVPAGWWPDPATVAVGLDRAGCPVLTSTSGEPLVTLDPTAATADSADRVGEGAVP